MISSLVISHLMDEKKSKENGAMLPFSRAIAPPQLCSTKPTLAIHRGVSIRRSFALAPDRLGTPSPNEQGLGTELPATEDSLGRGSSRGFASITITARRVGPAASALVWGTAGDPLCLKCKTKDAVLQVPPTLPGGIHPRLQHNGSVACAEFPRNGSMVTLKVPQSHTRLCAGHEYWVTHTDGKEDSFSPNEPSSTKSPLVFSSCVHLRVSRQCPSAIYYLDKPLSVPLEQPQIASPKVHRSVLSLNLRCSSHSLTADGVDSIANGEPMSRELKQEIPKGKCDLRGLPENPSLQKSHWKENPGLEKVHLEHGACPWVGSPPLENVDFADVGSNQVMVRKEKEDHATHHASSHANQLSIHIPGWSYRAGDYTCCDLVVKLKECKKTEDSKMSDPSPAPPSPATPEGSRTPDLLEDGSEPQPLLESSMTLKEALEVRKPQFISRSQERLKKLEHMVQQRKAQQKENLGQKSFLPVRANRKQFTVPHPLSDNLFKPKERCISEKEMHMRSKRIYNNLPEVKKKKEEQKKRVILQSNRLRAEVFKKQLLDQLLQRNAV